MGIKGRTFGSENYLTYTWKITKYDLENNTEHIGKYFSLKHFNEVNNTKITFSHLQTMRKLGTVGIDFTLEEVKNAKPSSSLYKWGRYNVIQIKEPVMTRIVVNREIEAPIIQSIKI